MALVFLLILIGIPVLEIYVFAEVGGIIGGWATVGLTLLTAALGALMFRSQGTAVLRRAQENLRQEQTPLAEIVDGVGLLLAAVLLFIPGFVTDIAGFLLFVPPLRVVFIGYLFRGLGRSAQSNVWIVRTDPGKTPGTAGNRTVIDGDYEDLTEDAGDSTSQQDKDADRKLPPR
ncbi:FxsA family protein [Nisaea acidiphila]|uniref:FxsA family protein n=1 Tax=Nisaea acidiphila TaxID=1862145 RepID=A0A9J7B0K2_9PROT|nr:FxsA family protein [Nisaea acidiphila]UUX52185.1 FxsA family protein [Nisaea acidiphila]